MDLFVFSNYTQDSRGIVDYPYATLEGASIIPNITSLTWIERYLEPGEFSFTVPIESNARSMVPVGSIISQVEAQEVMIVENHEIVESDNAPPEVKISGRSFEVFLENRVVGQDRVELHSMTTGEIVPTPNNVVGFTYKLTNLGGYNPRPSDAVEFIVNRLLGLPEAANAYNVTSGFTVPVYVPFIVPNADTINFVVFINPDFKPKRLNNPNDQPQFEISFDRKDAHTSVIETLGPISMGIANARAGLTSPIDFNGHGIPHDWPVSYKNKLAMLIYYGNDRREAVKFSYEGGDIAEAHYLLSNKNEKNSYFSTGHYRSYLYRGEVGYKQRTIKVDSTFHDEKKIAGFDQGKTPKLAGDRALAMKENQRTAIMEAKLVSQQKDLIYRRDYGTGDLVTVIGNHGYKETMQVIEYTETEDDTGEVNYPTLIIPSQTVISNLEKPEGERI